MGTSVKDCNMDGYISILFLIAIASTCHAQNKKCRSYCVRSCRISNWPNIDGGGMCCTGNEDRGSSKGNCMGGECKLMVGSCPTYQCSELVDSCEDGSSSTGGGSVTTPNTVTGGGTSESQSGCGADSIQVGDRCMRRVPVPLNWFQANIYCDLLGGQLAVLRTPQQLNDFREKFETPLILRGWIGLRCQEYDCSGNTRHPWRWLDSVEFDPNRAATEQQYASCNIRSQTPQ